MQVLNFHLFPYPPLPDEVYAKSAWVTLSNAHYDREGRACDLQSLS